MKILITGASGFIGGFLVKQALSSGYEVWAGVRKSSNRSELTDSHLHFIDLNYSNMEALVKQLSDFSSNEGAWDYIIHNAGVTKSLHKSAFFEVNAENTRRFVEALSIAGCAPRKFVLMSSLSSYGKGDEVHFKPIKLSDEQRPDTAYGKSKLLAECYLKEKARFPYVILRPTGVYGPGEKDYFVEIKSIYSGIDFTVGMIPQRITFIYVKDLVRVAFLALENEAIQNRSYFVADGDVYTDSEFALLVQELLGKKRVFHSRIPIGLAYIVCCCSEFIGRLMNKSMTLNRDKYIIFKQRNWICETEPLQKELGFIPEYSLRAGLKESIAWYKEKGWLK